MRGVDVVIDPAAEKLTVRADDNVIGYVITEVEDSTLTVTISNEVGSMSNCKVKVTVPDNGNISKISASRAADIENVGTLRAQNMEISAASVPTFSMSAAREAEIFEMLPLSGTVTFRRRRQGPARR